MNSPRPNKPFAMIREFHLADWFTLANAVCGTGALFSVMTYLQTWDLRHIQFACALVLFALIFDVLDGRIARWRQVSSALGRELDSLADVISFGVAPAMIAYGCGMQGAFDRIILVYFVACGVSRLARYNVTAEELSGGTGKVKYFGPNLWFGEVWIAGFRLHPLVLVFALSGSLMISRIRIPKL